MARTGENIYKRKDGRWEARYIYEYSAEGKAKYRSVYGISRQEAKQKRLLLIHETMLGKETAVSPVIIFKDLVKNWLNNTKLRVGINLCPILQSGKQAYLASSRKISGVKNKHGAY